MFKKGDKVRYINERGRVQEGVVERVVPKWFGGHKAVYGILNTCNTILHTCL